jgi:hypothetical protein
VEEGEEEGEAEENQEGEEEEEQLSRWELCCVTQPTTSLW